MAGSRRAMCIARGARLEIVWRATNWAGILTASRSATLGDELFVAGRLDEAMAAYRQALALSPGFAAARVGLDAILERARTRQPNEQLIQLLIDAYADNGANWEAIGWGAANQVVIGWPAESTPEVM